jgi:hypothetical protein
MRIPVKSRFVDANTCQRLCHIAKLSTKQFCWHVGLTPRQWLRVAPDERSVACPNQDVVYGVGSLALDLSPVVIQVPDFGDRFWVYQIVDLRTDSFVQLAKCMARLPVSICWSDRTSYRQSGYNAASSRPRR